MPIPGSLERTRFFFGRMLTVEDLNREQAYFLARSKRHNRYLHGWGIVTGLEVRLIGQEELEVGSGMAIDCAGNEIVIESNTCLHITTDKAKVYLTLTYKELQVGPTPTQNPEAEPGLVRESVDLVFLESNPAIGHRHMGPRTPGCGLPHPMCLASLTKTTKGWKLLRAKSGA
jgi:hypothetical protein